MKFGSNGGAYIVLGIILIYLLVITDVFSELGVFLQQIAYTTFYGAEFLLVLVLIVIGVLLYNQFKKDKEKASELEEKEEKEPPHPPHPPHEHH